MFSHHPFTSVSTTIRKPQSRHCTPQGLLWFSFPLRISTKHIPTLFPAPQDYVSLLVFWAVLYSDFLLFLQLTSQHLVHLFDSSLNMFSSFNMWLNDTYALCFSSHVVLFREAFHVRFLLNVHRAP